MLRVNPTLRAPLGKGLNPAAVGGNVVDDLLLGRAVRRQAISPDAKSPATIHVGKMQILFDDFENYLRFNHSIRNPLSLCDPAALALLGHPQHIRDTSFAKPVRKCLCTGRVLEEKFPSFIALI